MDSLDVSFNKAAHNVRGVTKRPSDATLLQLYALYKQATVGPCTVPAPSIFDLKGQSKHSAWKQLGSMSKMEAKQRYILLAESVMRDLA